MKGGLLIAAVVLVGLALWTSGCADAPCEPQFWYADADQDGFGDRLLPTQTCSAPPGNVGNASDCNDRDPLVFPGAEETCNGRDDNCDGTADESVTSRFFADTDGDGYGDPSVSVEACAAPVGYVISDLDCDDHDPNTAPQAPEQCNGRDDDCDGAVDEDVDLRFRWFRDDDGDGFGDAEVSAETCAQLEGFVADNTDCDDGRASVNPIASEVCGDGLDNDCDGTAGGCARQEVVQLAEITNLLLPEETSQWFGYAVSCDGDLDRDGFDDVVVVEPMGVMDGQRGTVFVVHGSIHGASARTPRWSSFAGAGTTWFVGWSAAHVGDVTGDGWPDLLVGSPYSRLLGQIDLLAGPIRPGVVLESAATLVGEGNGGDNATTLGFAVASAGDTDGDGLEDFIISAPRPHVDGRARVYLVTGRTGAFELNATIQLHGAADFDGAGRSIAGGGDLNGDGFDDFVVGADELGSRGDLTGGAYVVHGPVVGNLDLGVSAVRIDGEGAGDRAGWSVAVAGDLNADGFDDLIIGAPFHSNPLREAGAVYVLLGPLDHDLNLAEADARLLGTEAGEQAGWSLTGVGDMNGDGFDDIAIGAHGNSQNGLEAGAVYIVYGPILGDHSLAEADVILLGERPAERVGQAVAGRCDINGDGLGDLVIGAHLSRAAGFVGGAVYVIYGQGL